VPGYPIRTSSDPRSVDSSPRHIAASHVLHRLSMPRHPPCALKHLQTQKPKEKLHIVDQHTPTGRIRLDARNHYPITKHHTPPPRRGDTTHPSHHSQDNSGCCLRTQQCAGSLALSYDVCCCAPSPRPLQTIRAPHGSHPRSWDVFRGAP
jgi:hypothetical protein